MANYDPMLGVQGYGECPPGSHRDASGNCVSDDAEPSGNGDGFDPYAANFVPGFGDEWEGDPTADIPEVPVTDDLPPVDDLPPYVPNECPPGYHKDSAGVCVRDSAGGGETPDTISDPIFCPAGSHFDQAQNRCVPDDNGTGDPEIPPCPTGYYRDQSGVCVPIKTNGPVPTDVCQPGYHKDASGNCVPDVTAPPQPPPQPPNTPPAYNGPTSVAPAPNLQGWNYQGSGYQAPPITLPGSYSGSGTTVPPPPPPPPPVAPAPNFAGGVQMPTLGGLPGFTAPTVNGAPNYLAMLQGMQGFQAPQAPGAAPNYGGIVGGLPEYQRPTAPGAAPDFNAIAGQVGAYETPEGAFTGQDMYARLGQYATDWMGNPNPYMSEAVQAARAAGDLRLSKAQADEERSIAEWASSRGLVGSSYEGDQRVQLAEAIRRQRAQEEADYLKMLAGEETASRAAAGQFGLGTAELGRGIGADIRSEAQYKQEDSARRAALGLEAAGRQEGATMDRAQLEAQVNQIAQELALQRGSLEITAADREEAANIARARFGLDVSQLQAQSELALRGMSLDAAQMQEASDQFRSGFELQVQQQGFEQAYQGLQLQMQDGLNRAQLNLEAAIAGDQSAMQRAALELDQMKAMDAAVLDRAQIQQRDNEIAQRAWEIQGQWQMQGQELSQEQARLLAEFEIRRNEMQQREAQFRANYGLNAWDMTQGHNIDLLRLIWGDGLGTDVNINLGGGSAPATYSTGTPRTPPIGMTPITTGTRTPSATDAATLALRAGSPALIDQARNGADTTNVTTRYGALLPDPGSPTFLPALYSETTAIRGKYTPEEIAQGVADPDLNVLYQSALRSWMAAHPNASSAEADAVDQQIRQAVGFKPMPYSYDPRDWEGGVTSFEPTPDEIERLYREAYERFGQMFPGMIQYQ